MSELIDNIVWLTAEPNFIAQIEDLDLDPLMELRAVSLAHELDMLLDGQPNRAIILSHISIRNDAVGLKFVVPEPAERYTWVTVENKLAPAYCCSQPAWSSFASYCYGPREAAEWLIEKITRADDSASGDVQDEAV